MIEAVPAEQTAAAEKKRSLLRRVPTSLIVTLLGIALTAWLLPAFTKQWDDRQRAQDLRAGVAQQIAAATSTALIASRRAERRQVRLWAKVLRSTAFESDPTGSFVVLDTKAVRARFREENDVVARLSDAWLLSSIRIEARLRASFPATMVAQLHTYNKTLTALFHLAVSSPPTVEDARLIGLSRKRLSHDLPPWNKIKPDDTLTFEEDAALGFTEISNAVLQRQNQLLAGILAAHVKGYSTTAHDLLHDLIP